MDFARVVDHVGAYLDEHQIRWAICGGLGLAAYGLVRTTFDLDLIVDGDRDLEVITFLEASGYETIFRTCGFSNHVHPDTALGRVDLVFVWSETREKLFGSAREMPGPTGRLLLVPKPEHLAAMKVAAMKSDPGRTFQELADIRFLLTLPGVDRGEVHGYFVRHGLEDRFEELVATL